MSAADSEVVTPVQVSGAVPPVPAPPVPAASRAGVRLGRWLWQSIFRGLEWCFGVFCLIVGLAVTATLPIVQFLSLGYLLESAARVSHRGRLRDGLLGVRPAARLGGAVLATWILLQPLRLVAETRYSAQLLNPGQSVVGWSLLLVALSLVVLGHVAWACARGARLRSFLWPAPVKFWRTLRQGGLYRDARDRWCDFVGGLQLPTLWWKGVRGCVIAAVWLCLPITLMAISSRLPQGLRVVTALAGGMGLAAVLFYLPFLQVNFAREDRLAAGFAVRKVRHQFRRAPLAFWFALFFTLLLALPLYILKAELIPREAAWLPSLVFVVSILPARLLTGWVLARADRREQPRWFLWRWSARLAAVPVVLIYALVVYLTQMVSWYGAWSLYEQHAFLLPVPFVGL